MTNIKELIAFLWTITPAQWGAISAAVLGLWSVLCSTMAFLLGILGAKYPWAMRLATWFGDRGDRRARLAGNAAGAALPGGSPPALAMARSLVPRPSLIEMCPSCGSPAVLPHPANSQETHQ